MLPKLLPSEHSLRGTPSISRPLNQPSIGRFGFFYFFLFFFDFHGDCQAPLVLTATANTIVHILGRLRQFHSTTGPLLPEPLPSEPLPSEPPPLVLIHLVFYGEGVSTSLAFVVDAGLAAHLEFGGAGCPTLFDSARLWLQRLRGGVHEGLQPHLLVLKV